MIEKRALGRGISSLIPQKENNISDNKELVGQILISNIKTNKYQPRLDFDKEKLTELINSIKEKGVIQPVLVRKAVDGYELIAGERRLRAAKALNMDTIPAIIKNVEDVDMLEISLIENIQREELNPMEEAFAYQRFIDDFRFTQERIAQSLGKDRSTIANILRLLGLPMKIQDFISKGMITTGHAKAILSLPNEIEQLRVGNLVVNKGLSVRETENIIATRSKGQPKPKVGRDSNMADIENKLQQLLGTKVRVFHGKKRGKIQIEYYSDDDMNRVLDIIFNRKNVDLKARS